MNAVEWLREIPKKFGDKVFLIDATQNRQVTFAEMHLSACLSASSLKKRGFQCGDRIALILRNSSQFAEIYFGCLYAGIVTVPINPILTAKDIELLINVSQPKLIVVASETLAGMNSGWLAANSDRTVVLDDAQRFFQGLNHGSRQEKEWDDGGDHLASLSPEQALTLVFTSGTTALPTGIEHRLSDLVDNAREFCRFMGIGPENRFLGILAMTYLGGYYNLLLLPYVAGASVVLEQAFNAKMALNFWETPSRYEVNTLWLVPTILSILLEMDRGKNGVAFCREKVVLALVGTAPLSTKLRQDFEAKYCISLNNNFALSETLFLTSQSPQEHSDKNSVGKCLPGIRVSIYGDNGTPLPYGCDGEVAVCTPYLMSRKILSESGEVIVYDRQEWFKTGDMGVFKPTGELFITGRKKDLIIRGGVNVSPSAIESAILEFKGVLECAVVGIPHPIQGEEIAAVVRLGDIENPEAVLDGVKKGLKACLSPEKFPAYLFEVDDLPRSSTGKVKKAKIREWVSAKLQRKPTSEVFSEVPNDSPIRSAPVKFSSIVRRSISRPSKSVIDKVASFSTGLISDCLNRMHVVQGGVHSLFNGARCAGPAFTVEEVEGGNLMSHIALDLVAPGDVLVIDGKGVTSRACWGGLQTLMGKIRGLAGIVVFGAIRDIEEMRSQGLPIFALGASPSGPFKGWGGYINFPLALPGVVIRPGDVIVGDDDGLVVIPVEDLEALIPMCEQRQAMEQEWFARVKNGESTLEVVGLQPDVERAKIRFD